MIQQRAFTGSLVQPLRASKGLGHVPHRRRAFSVAVVSALTPEQAAKALEVQLKRSQSKAGQSASSATPSQPKRATEDDLEARRKAAREWITPWLEQTARKRSQETMAAVRGRVELLSREQEQAALSRLVGQTAAQEEGKASGSVPDMSAATAAASTNGAAASESQEGQPASKFAPTEVLDDGSVIYSMALLQSVDYEAVLAS